MSAPNDIVLACDPSTAPTADVICGRASAVPCSRAAAAAAIAALPSIDKDAPADLHEQMASVIVELLEELAAVRAGPVDDMTTVHEQDVENDRLRKRVAGLLDERRHAPKAAA